jgi:hypothetical protein
MDTKKHADSTELEPLMYSTDDSIKRIRKSRGIPLPSEQELVDQANGSRLPFMPKGPAAPKPAAAPMPQPMAPAPEQEDMFLPDPNAGDGEMYLPDPRNGVRPPVSEQEMFLPNPQAGDGEGYLPDPNSYGGKPQFPQKPQPNVGHHEQWEQGVEPSPQPGMSHHEEWEQGVEPSPQRATPELKKPAPAQEMDEYAKQSAAGPMDPYAAMSQAGEAPVAPAPEARTVDAPLPGEETLPSSVAGWAQRRADRNQGGMNALRAAFEREVGGDNREKGVTFENWLASKGIKEGMGIRETDAILNNLSPMDQQHVDRRRDQFLETFSGRWGAQMQAQGITVSQLEEVYDKAVAADKTGDPIMAGNRAVNKMFRGGMASRKAQQGRISVANRADQQNRARQFGMPIGTIQFFDSLQAAKTPQERANIFMLAHQSQPMMGYDKMAAMLMRGEIDNAAIGQWAGQMGGTPNAAGEDKLANIGKNAAAINANWGQDGYEDQAHAHATGVLGKDAKSTEVAEKKKQMSIDGARPVILSDQPLTPKQKVLAQQAFDDSSVEAFAAQLGLKSDDPRLPKLYQKVFDRAPTPGWFASGAKAIGGMVGAAAKGVRSLLGPFGQPAAPQAWAGQTAPKSSLSGPDPFE